MKFILNPIPGNRAVPARVVVGQASSVSGSVHGGGLAKDEGESLLPPWRRQENNGLSEIGKWAEF
jgi:hypothetical protein